MSGLRGARRAPEVSHMLSNRPASPAVPEVQLPSRHLFRAVISPNRIQDGVEWVASLAHLCTTTAQTVPASPAMSMPLLAWEEVQELNACHSPNSVCLVEVSAVLRMLFSALWTRTCRQIWHIEHKFLGWKSSLMKWTARYGFVGWHGSEHGEPALWEA